ncbi:unnamed protein product [Prorocentrum cordatum]|uniref:RNA-directed RNA polymerase n=1 Tax=Prorocentrum cordatum TaxID=2364126 RepID=A0ABN9U2T3_9DINO|nr:unnamed protein product [Polarella glacialis]
MPLGGEPPHKKPRVIDFGRGAHVTAQALSQILDQVRREGVPDASSPSTIQRERQRAAFQDTSFGKLLQLHKVPTTKGGTVEMYLAHPLGFLEAASKFSECYRDTLALDRGRNFITVLLYADEVTPGNPLAEHNDRKVQMCYWSFAELGFPALNAEAAWNTIAAVQATSVDNMDGNMSQVFKYVLRQFFGRADGKPDLRDGVSIAVAGEAAPRLVFGRLGIIVQDERAFKASMQVMGATAHKVCALCANAVGHRSLLLPDPSNFLVSADEVDISKFRAHTASGIRGIQRRLRELAAVPNGKTELEKYETLMGYKYFASNWLQGESLVDDIDVVKAWCWDWMHCYMVNGVYTKEVSELVHRLRQVGLGPDVLDGFLKQWQWPLAHPDAKDLCSQHSDNSPSGNASVFLSSAVVLEKWLRDVALPIVGGADAEVRSGIALCVVVQLLTIVNSGLVEAGQLATAIGRHLALHKAAYGQSLWLPKSHYTIHLPDTLRRHKCLLSVFVQERKHRTVKTMATGRHTTVSYNRGLMEEVTVQHLYQLKMPLTKPSLLNPRPATKRVRSLLCGGNNDIGDDVVIDTSKDAHVHCRVVCVGDVVSFQGASGVEFGSVLFHARFADALWTCIYKWTVVASEPTHVKCRVRCDLELISMLDIIEPCVYWPARTGTICQVLLPPRLKLRALGL